METILIVGIIWIVCGIFAYGITLGHFQHKFPTIAKVAYGEHMQMAIIFGLTGPFGFIVSLLGSDFIKYGLKFK